MSNDFYKNSPTLRAMEEIYTMPYVSNAQRKYFHVAEKRGDIPHSVVDDFDKASKGQKNLPEHVEKK